MGGDDELVVEVAVLLVAATLDAVDIGETRSLGCELYPLPL